MFVESLQNLPVCTKQQEDQRAYIKDMDVFQICIGNTWVSTDVLEPVVDQGVTQQGPKRAVAFAQLMASEGDFCLDETQEICTFTGGDVIRYWDGSLRYRISITRTKIKNQTSDPTRDLETQSASLSMNHESYWETSEMVVITGVRRQEHVHSILFHYDATLDQFGFYFDTNGDGRRSSEDELLLRPSLESR